MNTCTIISLPSSSLQFRSYMLISICFHNYIHTICFAHKQLTSFIIFFTIISNNVWLRSYSLLPTSSRIIFFYNTIHSISLSIFLIHESFKLFCFIPLEYIASWNLIGKSIGKKTNDRANRYCLGLVNYLSMELAWTKRWREWFCDHLGGGSCCKWSWCTKQCGQMLRMQQIYI